MASTCVIKLEVCVSPHLSCLCDGCTHAGKEGTEPRRETNLCFSRPEFRQDFKQKHGLEITKTRLAMNVISLPTQSVLDGPRGTDQKRKYKGKFTFANDLVQASNKAREWSFAFVRVSY